MAREDPRWPERTRDGPRWPEIARDFHRVHEQPPVSSASSRPPWCEQEAHDNSLIVKRFLFEAFDCYIALFYIAFELRDVRRH